MKILPLAPSPHPLLKTIQKNSLLTAKREWSQEEKITDLDGQVNDNLVLPTFPSTGPMSATSARL